jgi:tol-pal system protein YbgF
MRLLLPVVLASLWIMGYSGCSNLTMLRTQELRAVQAHVDSLNSKLTSLQTKIMEEQKAQGEMLRLMRADQQVRFDEIAGKVANVEGNLSENQDRLSKIDQKTAEFKKQLEAKLAADSVAANSRSAEIEKLFQVAMGDFNAGRYDIAMNGFKDLSSQFPDSPQAQESDYWVAECMYAKREFSEAEGSYINYIKRYPQGNRMCAALYKLGLTYEKQKKIKSRDIVWNKLIQQYPDSQEANVAKKQLPAR